VLKRPSVSSFTLLRRAWITALILVSATVLASCSALPNFNLNTGSADQAVAPTSGVPVLSEACALADRFLKAWEAGDYPTMYAALSGHSQQYSKDQFTAVYNDADTTMGHPKLTHTLDCSKATQQGTTAIINYDMTFASKLVGQFNDGGRVMRLSWGTRGWQIAWSTMDIFQQMVGSATLQPIYLSIARGTIYDRNGKVIAADGQTVYTGKIKTKAYPSSPETCFQSLATVFRLRYTDVVAELKSLTGLDYGIAIGTLDAETYNNRHAELEAACPIVFIGRTTRSLFHGGLAAQTVGYIGAIPSDQQGHYLGYAPGSLVGLAGIEEKYDTQLGGSPDVSLVIALPDGTQLRSLSTKSGTVAQDVTLTLDRDLQDATEQAISDAYNYAQPSWAQFSTGASVVVIDVKTGAILAMASYPSFDADVFKLDTQLPVAQLLPKIVNPTSQYARPALVNLATQEYSALGSVFKIISMAAALVSKNFTPNETYYCNGTWDGRIFGDHVPTGYRYDWIKLDPGFKSVNNQHGNITLVQALSASCDAYFWQVAGVLNQKNADLMSQFARQLGLGQSTGLIDLPAVDPSSPNSDLPGTIPDPTNIQSLQGRAWSIGDALNEVIGQGDVKVTPLQVGRMIASIANGGNLMRPYLVTTIGTAGAAPSYTQTAQIQTNTGIDSYSLRAIQQGLCGAVSDTVLGTANWFMGDWSKLNKNITVCGKTGTAQTKTAHPNGWFIAYAGPLGKTPDIAIVALVEHGREGSETAGPIVRRVLEAYYHLPYSAYPDFWTQPYQPMTDPNGVSDGGFHILSGAGATATPSK